MLEKNYNILVYIGMFDMQDGPTNQYSWIQHLQWKNKSTYYDSPRNIYYFTDPTGNQQVGGYARKGGSFEVLLIPKAGHLVPLT